MSLKSDIATQQRKVAEAAQAMKRIGDECRENPPDQMPDGFVRAKADLESASKEINRLKAIEAQAIEADEAARYALEPVGAGASREPVEVGGREFEAPLAIGAGTRARAGRSYERPVKGPVEARKHKAAFDTFLRGGASRFQIDHADIPSGPRNALMTSSGELGGFLVPADFRTELLSDVAAESIIMRLARRIPTTTNEATFPTLLASSSSARIYRSGFRGQFRTENETGVPGTALTVQNQPKFGQKNIPVHAWQPDVVLITPEMLEDAAINVESILGEVIGEQLRLEMDSACLVNGTGSSEPKGIIASVGTTSNDVASITASASATIDYNAIVNLVFGASGLPAQYRQGAVMAMNTATYATILQLNDGNDRPLVNIFTNPLSIYGYPIEFSEFLAVPAASAKVIIFGNFMHYGVAERTDMRIQRLDQTYPPNIAFLARARYGGDVLRPAAFKVLACGA